MISKFYKVMTCFVFYANKGHIENLTLLCGWSVSQLTTTLGRLVLSSKFVDQNIYTRSYVPKQHFSSEYRIFSTLNGTVQQNLGHVLSLGF